MINIDAGIQNCDTDALTIQLGGACWSIISHLVRSRSHFQLSSRHCHAFDTDMVYISSSRKQCRQTSR